MNNSHNEALIQKFLDEQKQRQQLSKMFVSKLMGGLAEDDIEFDEVKFSNMWETHNLGGFKKSADGRISRVTIPDWFQKHVLHKEDSYSMFKQVVEHVNGDKPDEIHAMRKAGFQTFVNRERSEYKPNICAKHHLEYFTCRVWGIVLAMQMQLH